MAGWLSRWINRYIGGWIEKRENGWTDGFMEEGSRVIGG